MGCHLAGTIAALLGSLLLLPFFTLFIPFVVWRMGRDRHPFIDEQGQAVMNFLLSMTLYGVAASVLSAFLFLATCGIVMTNSNSSAINNALLWMLYIFSSGIAIVAIFQVVVTVFAAVKAFKGESYRYPFALRFLGG